MKKHKIMSSSADAMLSTLDDLDRGDISRILYHLFQRLDNLEEGFPLQSPKQQRRKNKTSQAKFAPPLPENGKLERHVESSVEIVALANFLLCSAGRPQLPLDRPYKKQLKTQRQLSTSTYHLVGLTTHRRQATKPNSHAVNDHASPNQLTSTLPTSTHHLRQATPQQSSRTEEIISQTINCCRDLLILTVVACGRIIGPDDRKRDMV
ncbi:hypothetical protein RB195_001626 [Necator americanus]|uniref:Uncharacterized protein n=1 Tax=Necator americanus TaxID=51031 RepID=A0ABR1DF74_NECAM